MLMVDFKSWLNPSLKAGGGGGVLLFACDKLEQLNQQMFSHAPHRRKTHRNTEAKKKKQQQEPCAHPQLRIHSNLSECNHNNGPLV